MKTLQQRSATSNGTYVMTRRRRRADPFEWAVGVLIGGAFACSLLLTLALATGCVWLIVVVVQDLARRLGL